MLTQTLREMEETGLLTRHVKSAIPPAVEYRLTPLGSRFVEPVELLYAWGRDNPDALDQLGSRDRASFPDTPSSPLGRCHPPGFSPSGKACRLTDHRQSQPFVHCLRTDGRSCPMSSNQPFTWFIVRRS
ncbi:winged helix-turn-helix transcriptional regulator [Sphingomonas sp. MMS24-JH45]